MEGSKIVKHLVKEWKKYADKKKKKKKPENGREVTKSWLLKKTLGKTERKKKLLEVFRGFWSSQKMSEGHLTLWQYSSDMHSAFWNYSAKKVIWSQNLMQTHFIFFRSMMMVAADKTA